MPHILLIDDDSMLTEPLCNGFVRAGYTVSTAHDGHSGIGKVLVEHPDLIIMDVMMPGMDGWQVCQAVRLQTTVPIIMLTALDDATDRIRGLELGADDYLVKPFGFNELQAHVKAMLRRVSIDTSSPTPQHFRAGDIELNLATHTVTKKDQIITLRQKEYEILVLLMLNAERVVTRNELFDDVWGTDWLGDTRTLDVHMSWLRAKLEDDPAHPIYFQTIRGVGYRFAALVEN